MLEANLDALSRMMSEHMATPFPSGFRGLDIEGQDMVMLDADAYGYAAGVVNGPFSERHRAGLTQLTLVFEKVLPAINDEYATTYYTHVRDMAVRPPKSMAYVRSRARPPAPKRPSPVARAAPVPNSSLVQPAMPSSGPCGGSAQVGSGHEPGRWEGHGLAH
ncbi:hypothetical protein OG361_40385 [Streptomyces sp. NBC_00090]|uniref:hypothetical protein n=1 Tax=Streptomyces sp. NBC_00090 TaxID=2903619 RepID=UPI003255AB2C